MKHFVIGSLLALSLLFNAANAEEKDLRNTFAVVWNFVSADKDLINNNLADQAAETLALWKQGTIENVYMNTEAQTADLGKMTNVTYFIKAKDREAATLILDQQTFVKKQIAEYQLFPVGFLWLTTLEDNIEEK